jgi:hypothetical protein
MSTFKPSNPPKARATTSKPDEGKYFSLVPTPNPREMAVVVRESAATFNPTQVPEIGTAYKDSSFLSVRPRIQLQGFKDYVLLNFGKDGDNLWFKYGKNKVLSDEATRFRTFFTTQRFTWPAVLEDLYVVQTREFEQAVYNGTDTQTQPSYFPRYTFRPAASVSTVVLVEQFLSPTPWTRADITHRQPIPTGVHASWVGLEFDFQECLHPAIVIPEKVPGASVVSGVGVLAAPSARNLQRKYLPETNFLDWASFIYDDSVQPTDGFWLRERATYYPPARPQEATV